MFRFKQFTIHDDRCAMKVGTDGVLLGAWAGIPEGTAGDAGVGDDRPELSQGAVRPRPLHTAVLPSPPIRILDVGAGSGLVSLMMAQRFPQARITALELDAEAAKQARENAEASPFAERVEVEQGDFTHYESAPYDAIVSNPPFFEEDLLPPSASRASARHTAAGLTFAALVERSSALLRDGGWLSVIIPKTSQDAFHAHCARHDLTLIHATDVRTVERKAPKRVLLTFEKGGAVYPPVERTELVLMDNGNRSKAYSELCRDFYL